MKKKFIFLFILIPALLLSQGEESPTTTTKKKVKTSIPVQAQYSNRFKIKEVYFNKRIDPNGRGEMLEVQFSLTNSTDTPMDLYIFVIATYEIEEKIYSSFNRPTIKEKRMKNFCPIPWKMYQILNIH